MEDFFTNFLADEESNFFFEHLPLVEEHVTKKRKILYPQGKRDEELKKELSKRQEEIELLRKANREQQQILLDLTRRVNLEMDFGAMFATCFLRNMAVVFPFNQPINIDINKCNQMWHMLNHLGFSFLQVTPDQMLDFMEHCLIFANGALLCGDKIRSLGIAQNITPQLDLIYKNEALMSNPNKAQQIFLIAALASGINTLGTGANFAENHVVALQKTFQKNKHQLNPYAVTT